MSTFAAYGTGFPAKGKGEPPKYPRLPGLRMLGRRRISGGLSHYVERYHSSCIGVLPRCRECWSFSGIRGFLLHKIRKEERK